MSNSNQIYWTIGTILGASGVALGAFGAHALGRFGVEPARRVSWQTATYYQIFNSMALLMIADRNDCSLSGALITSGVGLFAGSIYALVLWPSWRILGPVTPIGGSLLIAGWLAMAFKK